MADYLGDFYVNGKNIQHKFMTVNASGVPTTLGNSPSLILYVNSSVSSVASGLTLTTDFDGRTGLNHVTFLATTSVTGITSGIECQICLAAGTVSGVNLNGYPICDFSLMNRSDLIPATAGNNKVAVNSSGSIAIDWGQVSNQSTSVNLSATTLNLVNTTTSVTNNVGAIVTTCNTVVPANVTAASTNIGAVVTTCNTVVPANVTAASTNVGAVITASSINVGAIVTTCNTVVPANVTAASTNIGAVITASSINVGAIVTVVATTTAVQSALAVGVWDATLANHLNAGSTGSALNSSSSAGDPWNTALPGVYGAGSAGNILGSIVQDGVTAIQAKTTGLTFTQANVVDANIHYVNDHQVKGTGASGNEWGPA